MATFERRILLSASPEEVFAWHARPGALQRLTPPWQGMRRLEGGEGVHEGDRLVFQVMMGPLPVRWVALHRGVEPGRQFVDEQLEGPFRRWVHTHRFEPAPGGTELIDAIDYEPPAGRLGELVGGRFLRAMLDRMFRYRHEVTAADLGRHAPWAGRPPLSIAVSGASGLVGRQLCAFLGTGGHRVVRLVRRRTPGRADEVLWDPAAGVVDRAGLEGLDAVVHLAGEGIAGLRWSAAKKARIRDSRVEGTGLLARTLAGLERPPKALVSASAVGIYGDRGDELLTEQSPAGRGFLAEVGEAWERAAGPAREAGIRVAHLRIGIVLTPAGGALGAMLPAFLAGVGGPVGCGRQFMSWIALDDLLGAILHLVGREELEGPVNGVAGACTNREFSQTLGRVLRRPALLKLPKAAVRLLLGEMGEALLIHGNRVVPERLLGSGFSFRYPGLEAALRHELGR